MNSAIEASSKRFICLSQNRQGFVIQGDNHPFTPWGFNYDHDEQGRLLEDYWETEWRKVEEDFREMKELGANVVRIHLQLGKFMSQPDRPSTAALQRLGRLTQTAQDVGLFLDITGLGCYHKKDVPSWYDTLSEQARWEVQARFWEAVAKTCAASSAVFCYDLMNEPVLPGANTKETEWLLGEFGGKYFVQRISLALEGRTRKQVARAWVDRLVSAIRKHDSCHLITVGVIPWVHVFPKASPLFYSPEVSENLDFASVHFYPDSGEVDKALTALKAYDIGKPLVIEEMFPLKCSVSELGTFVEQSRSFTEGWISFYWGKTPAECKQSGQLADALLYNWLEYFTTKAKEINPLTLTMPLSPREPEQESVSVKSTPFVHPGILHSRKDLDRMRDMVRQGNQPWKSGYEILAKHPQSQLGYQPRGPFEEIGRNPNVHTGQFDQDANAAYQCAVLWYITGDASYANLSSRIVKTWASTVKRVSGKDAILMAGLGPFKMINTAEILRYTYDGWSEADTRICEQMFKNVIYPTIKDFATFANGNWDTACIKTMMAIGVFCEDRDIFQRAVDYYYAGSGNGAITHYIINETGQCQESGRDQQHTQLGLGHLAEACQIAWNQGLDLYNAVDNRLCKGFEYTAKYNLGNEVPFASHIDTTGKYRHTNISPRDPKRFRPIWEMVWNHYHIQMGLDMPYTTQTLDKIRPEGAAHGADHPGFGTLLFSLPTEADSAASNLPTDYVVGADLSFLKQAEDRGVVFKEGGIPKPALQIFRDHGYNWIRLRLFHTPSRLPNNLAYTITLAQEAKQMGFQFLLNFHYSDTWADPAHQITPKAWQDKTHDQLIKAVREYTTETIAAFQEAGVLPDMVQIGNEITPGMLWPDGKLPEHWDNFAELLQAGIEGVRAGSGKESCPQIMLHIDKGGDKKATQGFFDKIASYSIPYDVIGQSFYPWWHGSLQDLSENMAFMANAYQKDIILVEVAYNWRPAEYRGKPAPFPETPEGQRQFLEEVNRVVLETPGNRGKGIFWWEPAVTGGLRNRGFFDDEGNALPVITVFDRKQL
ncbi:MAG: glycosyl hydrolase 53 family protein [Sedimentisphaerales bacterium]|nr:glycosyl hydrolase 53 family protein [Sedimentisphaerales bacterium]